jgi:hypothetical protein
MVSAQIEMLRPVVALSALPPQDDEPITPVRVHDACNMLRQPARRPRFVRACGKIDERPEQLPG